MLEWIKANSKGFGVAVLLHLIFFGALFFNWEMDKPKAIVLEQGDVIQVTSVDANSYEAEIRKIEEKKRSDERKKQQRIKQKKADEKRKKQERVKKKQQEKKRKAEAKKKEQQRKAALLKEKKLKEDQLLKEKQRIEAEQKSKKAAAARKKEEAEKKAAQDKKRQEAEQKRLAEEDKKRQAELKRQQERDRAEWKRKSKGIINRHAALIQRKIEQNWRQPLDVTSNLKCRINIILQPTGKVVSVRILDGSGSQAFDRSVETAVRKASPLPVPENREIFEQFRNLTLSFEPGSY
ncbi:MAG: cell envelope integrity protein TolA [gamma proteobacterium symbiont of Taylorina sp.]|nr:cell envelope integrity protein TolA [gamma proteobacterium symbiont of Taylorina sp.]